MTHTQNEQALENALIEQLGTLGYCYVSISNEAVLKANLTAQLEKHNDASLSGAEFEQVLTHLKNVMLSIPASIEEQQKNSRLSHIHRHQNRASGRVARASKNLQERSSPADVCVRAQ